MRVTTPGSKNLILRDNTFFLDPKTYWVEHGRLRVDNASREKVTKNRYLDILKFFGSGILAFCLAFITKNDAAHIAGIVSLLAGIVWAVLSLINAIKKTRIDKFGIILLGTADKIEGRLSRPGRYSGPQFYVYINYSFIGPTGQLLKGLNSSIRKDLEGVELPPPGTPVVINYLNNKIFEMC